MANPYVYSPPAFEPTPHLVFGSPYTQRSPFLPPASLYPSSPYPPSSPYLGPTIVPQAPPLDDDFWSPPPRARRPSWHGGLPQPGPFLSSPPEPTHHRRSSFGGLFRPWESSFQLHPLLNGEVHNTDLFFDLASPTFAPLYRVGPGAGQYVMLADAQLREPATYPPITRMRITHDTIPRWPVDIQFNYGTGYDGVPTSITLGDVLYMIHSSLRRQITHKDWAQLSLSQETAIARAYTRRYRSVPSTAELEASQGVKQVDYLRDKHVFKGLIRARDEDGYHHWKFLTK